MMLVSAGGGVVAQERLSPRPAADDVPVLVRGIDREAEFAAFVTSAAPALGRTAWLLCGDAHRAEELVQHTLVRTYLAWDVARQGEPLAYARRVLANLRIDTWRKQRREVLTDPGQLPEGVADHDADRHASRDQLARALLGLPARRRRVVVLRYVVGLTEREVAEDLGISVGAVKSAGSRGLAQLRGLLAADDGPQAGRHTTPREATRR
jgi:RNA polymerase sigma-70 factor (sigma-E family)